MDHGSSIGGEGGGEGFVLYYVNQRRNTVYISTFLFTFQNIWFPFFCAMHSCVSLARVMRSGASVCDSIESKQFSVETRASNSTPFHRMMYVDYFWHTSNIYGYCTVSGDVVCPASNPLVTKVLIFVL